MGFVAPLPSPVLYLSYPKGASSLKIINGKFMAFKGKRTKLIGPWHYCARCINKTQISEMQWQRGLLLCPDCVDYGNEGYPLIGQRESAIAQVLGVPTTELQPDPKLTDSNAIDSSIEEELIW